MVSLSGLAAFCKTCIGIAQEDNPFYEAHNRRNYGPGEYEVQDSLPDSGNHPAFR